MRRSTAVSFLTAFTGEKLALVKPVAGPLSSGEGTCVWGPITDVGPELCWPLALWGPWLPLVMKVSEGSLPLASTAHCSPWVLDMGLGLGNTTPSSL